MDSVSLSSAYMWAIVTLVVLFLAAVVIANAIPYKPNDTGTTKRRVWFWILAACTFAISFLINYLCAQKIDVPSLHSSYMMHSAIASSAAFVVYIILGFAISKMFGSSKVSTWF